MTKTADFSTNGIAYSYLRFSSNKQELGGSIVRQTEGSEAYAAKHDLRLDGRRMKDMGISAFHSKNIKEGAFAGFLAAIRSGQVKAGSTLILENLDRMSRDEVIDAFQIFVEILRAGVAIVTLMPERIYTRKSASDVAVIMEVIMQFYLAHQHSEKSSIRIKAQWAKKREKAQKTNAPITGKIPSWLTMKDGKFEVIPSKEKIVKKIFELYLDGKGLPAITNWLNGKNIPTLSTVKRKGTNTWHTASVQKILITRTVLGEFQPHELDEQGKRIPSGKPIKNYYPAIITPEVFASARKIQGTRTKLRGRTGKLRNLFTGIMHSLADGSTMVTSSKCPTQPRYISSHQNRGVVKGYTSFRVDYVETAFLYFVDKLSTADLAPVQTTTIKQSVVLEQEIKQDEETRDKIKKNIMKGEATETLLELLRELDTRIMKTGKVLQETLARENTSEVQLLQETREVWKLVKDAPPEEQYDLRLRLRQTIRNMVETIHMHIWKEGDSDRWCLLLVKMFDTNYFIVIRDPMKRGRNAKTSPDPSFMCQRQRIKMKTLPSPEKAISMAKELWETFQTALKQL